MQEKNLVEEAVIQLKNLEEAINENAKEILASTMKEEISELVKESMKNEAEEEVELDDIESEEGDESSEEDEMDMDMDMEDEDEMELDLDSDDMEDEMDMDIDMDMDSEEDEMTVDLTDASDEEILKVFKSMNDDDTISIEKDGDYIHLTDDEDEYLIQTESMDEEETEFNSESLEEEEEEEEEEEIFYEGWDTNEEEEEEEESEEEVVYEIELDDELFGESQIAESTKGKKTETKESKKPVVGKGAKTGSASKFSYKSTKGGFNEKMKQAKTTKGHSHKFEFTENEEVFEMPTKSGYKMGKEEAKEAARTYGFGSKEGRGLRKGITPNRNLTFESSEELETLRAKNEEYRKALNMFKDKLNEVAVFNSNLAYATRLFTEHSTSKQEKINILRRFDSAESLKESKALYKTIKDELGTNKPKFVTESIEKVIEKAPQSGSAVNLIESKTYENPQFMRMKDIMSKIIK